VAELANQLGMYFVYIPPYSPNLNLIERLWKHVKNKLRTKYYDDFDEFQERINSIVSNTDKHDYAIISRLIGEKVQLFDESHVVSSSVSCDSNTASQAA